MEKLTTYEQQIEEMKAEQEELQTELLAEANALEQEKQETQRAAADANKRLREIKEEQDNMPAYDEDSSFECFLSAQADCAGEQRNFSGSDKNLGALLED